MHKLKLNYNLRHTDFVQSYNSSKLYIGTHLKKGNFWGGEINSLSKQEKKAFPWENNEK